MRASTRRDVLISAAAGLLASGATTPRKAVAAAPRDAAALDVPYVWTPQVVVERMLDLARVTRDDIVYDLGSGDGRIVVTAAMRFGARGLGVDIDPARVADGRRKAAATGVSHLVRFVQQDLFETDLREATVVTMYLLQDVNLRLRPRLLEQLQPGARVVSHTFDMGDWEPDRAIHVERPDGESSMVYLWVLPARVAGRWDVRVEEPGGSRHLRLHLEQTYQKVSGTATVDGRDVPVEPASLAGDRLTLAVRDARGAGPLVLDGRVEGDRLVPAGGPLAWTATRAGR